MEEIDAIMEAVEAQAVEEEKVEEATEPPAVPEGGPPAEGGASPVPFERTEAGQQEVPITMGGSGSGHWGHEGRPGEVGGSGGGGGPRGGVSAPVMSAYFKAVREVMGKQKPKGFKYASRADFLEKEGQAFEPGPRPEGVAQGKVKECYRNAYNLAEDNPERYVYTEGMGTTERISIPLDHAWVVDRTTGKVVDPTWTDGREYVGVPMSQDFVRATIVAKGTWGVIENYEQEFPLLREGMKAGDREKMPGGVTIHGGPGGWDPGAMGRPRLEEAGPMGF